jgi:hypothetical protein
MPLCRSPRCSTPDHAIVALCAVADANLGTHLGSCFFERNRPQRPVHDLLDQDSGTVRIVVVRRDAEFAQIAQEECTVEAIRILRAS